jgi:hypothetical protein
LDPRSPPNAPDSALARSIAAAEGVADGDDEPALATTLAMLQQLAVDDGERARAERHFTRILLRSMHGRGALLDRLLGDERTAVLSEPLQRCIAFLRALAEGRLAAARALLPALLGPGGTAPERILASYLLLHDQRLTDAARALADLDDRADLGPRLSTRDIVAFGQRRTLTQLEPASNGDPVFLTLCSCLRDEARYLEEWIVHHALLGVDRFCLYDNESRDETPRVLDALTKRFPIEVRSWVAQPANQLAFEDCARRNLGRTAWLACIDADEFLMPAEGEDLRELLRSAGDASAVVVNWRIFGSSGFDRRPPGLCLENFVRRAPDDFPPNRHIKSVLRPERVLRALSPHQFAVLGHQVDGDGKEVLPLAGRLAAPSLGRIALNHYIVRSREDFEQKKVRGRLLDSHRPLDHEFKGYFEAYDRNEVLDRSAWRYVPAIQKAMRRSS